MFKGLGNLAEMIKQFGRLRSELNRIGEELEKISVEGIAGGGMVRIRVNGKQELLDCKIYPQVFLEKDPELLEDLIVAATNQALEKAKEAASEKFREVGGGLNVEGLTELLGTAGEPPRS